MTTLSRTYPTARSTYNCTSCGSPITAGTRYHCWKGTGDEWEGIATARECAECAARYGRPFPPATNEEQHHA